MSLKEGVPKILEVVRNSGQLLNRRVQIKFILASVAQILLSILDLVSVAVIGVVASIAVRGVQSQAPGIRTMRVLTLLKMDHLTFHAQVAVLTLIAVCLLMAKTFVSVFVTKRTLYFLARNCVEITEKVLNKILSQSLSKLHSRNLYDLQFIIGPGINKVILGILGVGVTVLADLSLIVVLTLGLLFINPVIALSSFIFFSLVAISLHFMLRKKSIRLGNEIIQSEIIANKKISEAVSNYRELYVRNKRDVYVNQISSIRSTSTFSQAEQTFIPNISKYVIEVSIILGSVLIAGIQFLLETAPVAFASIGLFLMAGGRIAPALMRLQQSLMQIEANSSSASLVFELLEGISEPDIPIQSSSSELLETYTSFSGDIKISNLSFAFSDETPLFDDLNLEIRSGSFVALVGPSGSGKTTLVSLILGLEKPSDGEILISGMKPQEATRTWPGVISYVPQHVAIINGSLKENVEIGFDSSPTSKDKVLSALHSSNLDDIVEKFREGIDTQIGDGGIQLSGGQRQRIGIARALYTSPKLLVLDEATSALDSITEEDISNALKLLPKDVTKIVIAHRLSTVKEADLVVYIDHGNISAKGTFEEVRNQIPDFDRQANLMGL